MILLGHDLIAMTGGSGDSDDVSGGGGNAGSKGAKINREITDRKGKLVKGVVDIFKTGFKNKGSGGIGTGSILADGVGEGVVEGIFLTGGDVEITPVDNVVGGRKVLGDDIFGEKKCEKYE